MLRYLLLLFFIISCLPCPAQYFDTLHIHYDIGKALLRPTDKHLLDSVAQFPAMTKLLIYSYADYLGTEQANRHLSGNRASEVKAYLLQKGVSPQQIMECTGLGRVAGSGGTKGDILYRRTDLFIRKEKNNPVRFKEHNLVQNKEVFLPEKKNQGIPVREEEEEQVVRVTKIDLDTLKVNETLNLKNIQFYPGKADVITRSYPELENLYRVLYDHPKLKIRLEGHVCCCVYPDGYFEDTPTWALSVRRARVIYDHLISRGIAAERMQCQGLGRTRPILDHEKTVEEGQVNRRVEIRILDK